MSAQIQITFDAHEPARLADFWALALGYQPQPPPPGFATWQEFAAANDIPEHEWGDYGAVVDPDGDGPRLLFLKVPEGKTAKNRVHLDVGVEVNDGQDRHEAVRAHVAKLVSAGATYVKDYEERGSFWVVCHDPEGNEFCVH